MSEPTVDDPSDGAAGPEHPEESRWYTEHTALLISTLKWSLLGAGAGVCVGFGVLVLAFLFKIVATAVTLETGGSGGIVTPLFFIGATSGAALAQAAGLPSSVFAAFGFVSVLAAAANTPIAAAVMGMELLPGSIGVYAALCAGMAYLIVGHRSVYASQKLGFSKSAGLEMPLDVPIGEVTRTAVRVKKGSLTEVVHQTVARRGKRSRKPP